MNDLPGTENTQSRLRRPTPERTVPLRGVLRAFDQRDGYGAQAQKPHSSHPLGDAFADTATAQDTGPSSKTFDDPQMQSASDLIDRHIEQGAGQDAPHERTILDMLSGLGTRLRGGGLNGADLNALVTQLARNYSEVATLWADLAGHIRAYLAQNKQAASPPSAHGAPNPEVVAGAPVVSISTACEVEVRVEMFKTAANLQAQELSSDQPGTPARISDVTVQDGRLRLKIPKDQPPGTYFGLLLDSGVGPAGIVTVTVAAPAEGTS